MVFYLVQIFLEVSGKMALSKFINCGLHLIELLRTIYLSDVSRFCVSHLKIMGLGFFLGNLLNPKLPKWYSSATLERVSHL